MLRETVKYFFIPLGEPISRFILLIAISCYLISLKYIQRIIQQLNDRYILLGPQGFGYQIRSDCHVPPPLFIRNINLIFYRFLKNFKISAFLGSYGGDNPNNHRNKRMVFLRENSYLIHFTI